MVTNVSLLTVLNEAKGALMAVTAIGGGAISLNQLHVSQAEFDQFVAGNRVQTILQLQQQAAREGSPAYLCAALEAEFAALCTEQPDHYFCVDSTAKREILAKAGCR